ncbi:unnamed protein product, partial [marine sediment metagenome]
HDEYVQEKTIFGFPQHWVDKIWQRCACFSAISGGHFDSVKDTQAWIQRALSDVKTDLAGIEKATVEHEVEPVKEAANLKMETVVDAKEDPVLQDLSKQLFNLDEVIVDLTNYKGRDPEYYVYDLNQTLEKILNVKKLATTLFNQLKLPRLRDLSILLVKLHRDVQYIHDELDWANSPGFNEIPGEEELNAKRAKEAEEAAFNFRPGYTRCSASNQYSAGSATHRPLSSGRGISSFPASSARNKNKSTAARASHC